MIKKKSYKKKKIKKYNEMTSEDIDMFNDKKMDAKKKKNICDTHIDGA